MNGHIQEQKENLYRDIRNAYYTGCFAQVEKPKEYYDKIVGSIDSKPQSAEEMFGFLKNMSDRLGNPEENQLKSNFRIPLKLTPEFDVSVFNYICAMEEDVIELHLPDVSLSLNNKVIKDNNGFYTLGPGIVRIKYNDKVYTVILIRS